MPRGRKRKANTAAPDPSTVPDKETTTEPPASQTHSNCLTQNSEGRFVPRFSKRQKQETTQPPPLAPPLEGAGEEVTVDSHIPEETMLPPATEKGGALSLINNAKEIGISTSLLPTYRKEIVLEEIIPSQNDSSDKIEHTENLEEETNKLDEINNVVPNMELNLVPQNEEESPSNDSEIVKDVASTNTSTDKNTNNVIACNSSSIPDNTCNDQLLQSPSSTALINEDTPVISLNQGAQLLPSTIEDVIITCINMVEKNTNTNEAAKEEIVSINDDSLIDLEAIGMKGRQDTNITPTITNDTAYEPGIDKDTIITSPPSSYPNIKDTTITTNHTEHTDINITTTTISSTPVPPPTGLDDRVTTIGDDCIGEVAVHRLDDSLTLDDIENFVCLDFSEDPNTLQIHDTTKGNNLKLTDSTPMHDQPLMPMQQKDYGSTHKSVIRSLYPSAMGPVHIQSSNRTSINDVGSRVKDLTMAQVPSISPCKQDGLQLPDSSHLLKELINEMTKLNQYVHKCRQDLEVAKKQRASWLKLQHNRSYRQTHQYHHQY